MQTTLILKYTAYVEVKLPNNVAEKMKSGEIEFHDRWGVVTYTDEKGEHEVEGSTCEVDYKRSESHYFEDNKEAIRMEEWNKMLSARRKAREEAYNKITHDNSDAIRDPENKGVRPVQSH